MDARENEDQVFPEAGTRPVGSIREAPPTPYSEMRSHDQTTGSNAVATPSNELASLQEVADIDSLNSITASAINTEFAMPDPDIGIDLERQVMADLKFYHDEMLSLDVPGCSDAFAEIISKVDLPAPLKILELRVHALLASGQPHSACTVAEKRELSQYLRTMGRVLKLWKIVDRWLRDNVEEQSGSVVGTEGPV